MVWYQTWWGITLAGLVALVVGGGLFFGVLVGKYWWDIKQGKGEDILKKLRQIQPQAQEDPLITAKRKELESTDDPFLGNPEAKIVIVEFMDYRCSNCKETAPIIHKIIDKYGYKVKVIARDFPVETAHPGATRLSEIAYCADKQGKFWQTHDVLYQNQSEIASDIDSAQIAKISALANLDNKKLQSCLQGQQALLEVNSDYSVGYKYQMRGTPTFFINGEKVSGVVSWEEWEKYLSKI